MLMVKKTKTEQRSGVPSTQAVTPEDTASFGVLLQEALVLPAEYNA